MAELKLAKLPDRVPVRISISVSPDLNLALNDYACVYEEAYGKAETASDLIPAMLETFLSSDKTFARMRKPPEEGRSAGRRKVE